MRNMPARLHGIAEAIKAIPERRPQSLFTDAVRVMVYETLQLSGQITEQQYVEYEQLQENYAGILAGFSALVATMTAAIVENPYRDVLGDMYEQLEIGRLGKGQFLTPGRVAQAMGNMSEDNYARRLETEPVIEVADPTCGSGVFLLKVAKVAAAAGYDPSDRLVMVGMDIDSLMSAMCFLQMSLNGLVGYVINTGSFTTLCTPLYIGMLRAAAATANAAEAPGS